MKKLLIGLLMIAAFMLVAKPLPCAEEKKQALPEEKVLKVVIPELRMIPVKVPNRIVVNNPNIADVAAVTRDTVTITPKEVGATALTIWDEAGEHPYKIKVLPTDLDVVKKRIDAMLSALGFTDVKTKVEEDEGKVFLTGFVKKAEDREKFFTALAELKKFTTDLIYVKEEETSIDINVTVFEISKGAQETMGFLYPTKIALTDVSGPITVPTTGLPNIFYVSKFTRNAFNFTWDFLEGQGKIRILSRPRLTCQSGKEADLLVGGQKPTFSSSLVSNVGTSTSIDYKDFGVKLKIKPIVTADKRIKIALTVEVIDISSTAAFLGSEGNTTALAYPLTIRRATTEVFLDNGSTMAIGGLITDRKQEDVQKVPWASNLPLVGALFRHKDTIAGGGSAAKNNTELFITLTPTIVPSEAAAVNKEEKAKEEVKEEAQGSKEKPVEPNETQPQMKARPPLKMAALSKRPAAPEEDVPAPLHNYKVIVQKKIMDKVKYPIQAKESGFQGTVKISLNLSYKGDLLDAKVKESSGYQLLDKSALAAAHSVIEYPPFPPSLNKDKIWIDIPVDYQLN
ncbi:MAG: TonB family protein [Candidatus Omnitrophota bacterium]